MRADGIQSRILATLRDTLLLRLQCRAVSVPDVKPIVDNAA